MKDILACYKILDLEPGASADRIRRSYIELTHVWDPVRYMSNPVLQARAEEKRAEIDEAYLAIRAFLPALQSPPREKPKSPDATRDYMELSTAHRLGWLRAVLIGLVIFGALALTLWAATTLLEKSRAVLRLVH